MSSLPTKCCKLFMDDKTAKSLFYGGLSYQKQSFRNRAEIYGANGKLKLTIPIKHSTRKLSENHIKM